MITMIIFRLENECLSCAKLSHYLYIVPKIIVLCVYRIITQFILQPAGHRPYCPQQQVHVMQKKNFFSSGVIFFLKLYTTSAAILLLIKYYDVVLFTTVFVDNVLSIIIPLWSCPKILHIKHLCKANLCTLKSGCMESNFSNFFFYIFYYINSKLQSISTAI